MRIAVIPARGGSKRVPRKNVREFCGRPMLGWPIGIAKASGLFDHVIVSTDDPGIAEVARKWGAETPFSRPDELSNDHAGTLEVVAHATRWGLEQGWPLTAVCCIYATAAFLRAADLERGLAALESGDWAYAFSATKYTAPIFRSFRQLEAGGIEMLYPEHATTRSQDLPEMLHDAGQFYWGRPSAWIGGKKILDSHSLAVMIPPWRVHDIDDEDEWIRAELAFHQMEDGRA